MASVCLYFQVHQPFRLRRYSVFDTDRDYFMGGAEAKAYGIIDEVVPEPDGPVCAHLQPAVER